MNAIGTTYHRQEPLSHESDGHYRLLFESNPHPMWVFDRDTLQFLAVNDAAVRQYGYSRDEFLTMTICDIRPPEEVAEMLCYFETIGKQVHTGRINHAGFWRHRRKDGSLFDVEVSGSPIRFGDHDASLVLAVDVTERRRAELLLRQSEQALRRQKDQFTTLVEHIPDIVARLDRDLRFQYISPAVRAVTGQAPEEYIGKLRTNAGIAPEFARAREELSRKVFETGQEHCLDFPIQTPSGERHLETRLIPEFAPDGSVESLMTLTRDITERKLAEQALREADRRKDEFLATLAHELRNPLAPLRNSLDILRLAGELGPTAERIRDLMERQVNQMVHLVDDLLEISRISRGTIKLNRERLELALIVRAAVETSAPLIESAQHQLTIALPAEPLAVDGDAVRLTQVLANLLNNAAKYTKNAGQIWLSACREGRFVAISVRDNGIGIPAEILPRVFEMFTQGERGQGGLGIGLAIVRNIVRLHDGTVEAHSDGVGQGSEFIVRLPLADSSRVESPSDAATAPFIPMLQRRILVVDDNRDAADCLAMLLKFLGADVHVVNNGASALQSLSIVKPHLIFLDIGMPDMSGYDVARRMRERPDFRDCILVALTGWGQEEDRRRSSEAGFHHHLVKPVTLDTLQMLMHSLK